MINGLGIEFFNELPDGYTKCTSYYDLLKLSPKPTNLKGNKIKKFLDIELKDENYNKLVESIKPLMRKYQENLKLHMDAKLWKHVNFWQEKIDEITRLLVRKEGLELMIYSPTSKVYYPRIMSDSLDINKLNRYIRDQNLYKKL